MSIYYFQNPRPMLQYIYLKVNNILGGYSIQFHNQVKVNQNFNEKNESTISF